MDKKVFWKQWSVAFLAGLLVGGLCSSQLFIFRVGPQKWISPEFAFFTLFWLVASILSIVTKFGVGVTQQRRTGTGIPFQEVVSPPQPYLGGVAAGFLLSLPLFLAGGALIIH